MKNILESKVCRVFAAIVLLFTMAGTGTAQASPNQTAQADRDQTEQAAPSEKGNGPNNINAGTLVYGSGQRYQVHSSGGLHSHHQSWTGYGILGAYDYGYKLYKMKYCSGEISQEKKSWGWTNYCNEGRWSSEYFDPDSMAAVEYVG